jgi:hypothetical protein
MSAKERREGSPSLPDTDPSGNYSFLEIVMSMQNMLGRVCEAVESLKTQAKHHDDKLDQIGKDVHAAKVVVGVLVGIVLAGAALVGWIVTTYISAHPAVK